MTGAGMRLTGKVLLDGPYGELFGQVLVFAFFSIIHYSLSDCSPSPAGGP